MKYKNKPTFNTEGSIFMSAKTSLEDCKIVIYGVPYDGTTSFRPGTRFGPSAIRNVSNALETYCPQLEIDIDEINFADIGNLNIPFGSPEPVINEVEKATKKFIQNKIKPLMLGGEHSITTGAIKALSNHYKNLIVIQLDAHADLREEWLGSKHSHACTIKRCLDILPSKTIFQVGIRSGTKHEFEEMKNKKRLINHIKGQPCKALEEVLRNYRNHPIYLTIDLDWFDPSILPGTGTPEPGGFFWDDFKEIVDILKKHNLIGADVVELAPQLDSSGISSILAAKVVRSLIILLNK